MMKKLALLVMLVLTISCAKDDEGKPIENQEYLDELIGLYQLNAAYVENPIDLNGDGI